ncbi:MAG: hypothetical protein JW984_07730 [Deltaproteobacteria bacterium]|uniref:Uncharacterized protein n=1 Tax=Candidatus Zymogenus saltonus TaxID=2844893 RepID=A0A9D8KEL3_9DELT|nr:hypothetical protein [Candidatus Zymogenus saltonus]
MWNNGGSAQIGEGAATMGGRGMRRIGEGGWKEVSFPVWEMIKGGQCEGRGMWGRRIRWI